MFLYCFFFFFNDTATTEIYTLSLHDALPISRQMVGRWGMSDAIGPLAVLPSDGNGPIASLDRKSTRLNSSHGYISYAVFCLKKKNYRALHHHLEDSLQRAATAEAHHSGMAR